MMRNWVVGAAIFAAAAGQLSGQSASDTTANPSLIAPPTAETTAPVPPPAAPAPPAPAPTTPQPPSAGATPDAPFVFNVQDYTPFVAFLEGDVRGGTGVLVKLPSGFGLVTVAHLLIGNTKVTVHLADGTSFPVDHLSYVEGRDLVLITSPKITTGLAVPADFNTDLKLSDRIAVLGSTSGTGVVGQQIGRITGIGPAMIELNARFADTAEGSPAIQTRVGKMLGVAAVIMPRTALGSAPNPSQARHIAIRIDNVPSWIESNWAAFTSEDQPIAAAMARTKFLREMTEDISKNGMPTSAAKNADNPFHSDVADFQEKMAKTNMNPDYYLGAKQDFLFFLADACDQDIRMIEKTPFSPPHALTLQDIKADRKELAAFFRNLHDRQDSTPTIQVQQ